MDRRTFISGVVVGLLTAAHGAEAQQARKVYKIGYLTLGGPSFPYRTAFVQGLREHGWIEDQNFILEARFAKGRREDLPGLVADLLRANVDVVVTTSTRETLAVKEATSTIPIVMTLVPDPVAEGIVASLARPGGNITGVTNLVPGLSQKYVELLREAVPSAARFAVVTGPRGTVAAIRRELEAGATALGMELVFTAVQGPDDFDMVLAQAKKDGAGGIIVVADPLTLLHRRALVQAAIKHRLPGMYWAREYVEDGGLMTYSANLADLFRHAATYVDKILRGAKPGDLPIEQPTKFDFVINMKTAKALGLTIPQSVLLRADEVIQ